MLKINHIITKSETGGAQTHLIELCNGLRIKGYDIEVATGQPGPLVERLTQMGIAVKIIPTLRNSLNPLSDLNALKDIRNWLISSKPDVVHLHSSKAGLLGRAAAYSENIPSVFTAHGWAFTEGANIFRKLIARPVERLAGRLCQNVICVSSYDYNLALRHKIIPKSKLRIVHNGISEAGLSKTSRNSAPLKLIMVARFAPPKQQKELIAALKQWKFQNWELDLVGDGPDLEACKLLAEELALDEKVKFLGNQDNIHEILQNADLFVLLSRYEGLPISIIEAMRAGLPVIASDVGGVNELVDGDIGFLIRPGDVASLLAALDELTSNHLSFETMGRNSRTKYQLRFSAAAMVEKTERIYHEAALYNS